MTGCQVSLVIGWVGRSAARSAVSVSPLIHHAYLYQLPLRHTGRLSETRFRFDWRLGCPLGVRVLDTILQESNTRHDEVCLSIWSRTRRNKGLIPIPRKLLSITTATLRVTDIVQKLNNCISDLLPVKE